MPREYVLQKFRSPVELQIDYARELNEQQHSAVTILNVGGSDQRMQQQTELVDQDVTLLALDQPARVEEALIDASSPDAAS